MQLRNLGAGVWVACALLGAATVWSAPDVQVLKNLSIEELSNIQITSVSKRDEKLSDAPTSVFVITSDDIRRSGATSLPEALRLAPNLQVARISANEYAISARGFNSTAANKLLVLIDGRSVYSPLFSGVFWDVQNVMIEDIERIEVISGSGGTLWGVNAVNGVINVITRSAAQTQGGLVAAGGGNREDRASLRYGGTFGDAVKFRVYATHFDMRDTETESGDTKDDAVHQSQVGFRADWQRDADSLMVKGDAYTGREEQPPPGSISISGVTLALGEISVSGANMITVGKDSAPFPCRPTTIIRSAVCRRHSRTRRASSICSYSIPQIRSARIRRCGERSTAMAWTTSLTAPISHCYRQTSIKPGPACLHKTRSRCDMDCV